MQIIKIVENNNLYLKIVKPIGFIDVRGDIIKKQNKKNQKQKNQNSMSHVLKG